jgi:hypothetical protein
MSIALRSDMFTSKVRKHRKLIADCSLLVESVVQERVADHATPRGIVEP